MESRNYNHPSVRRLRHARFHMIIICLSIAIWNLRIAYNHPSVCRLPHARFHDPLVSHKPN
jgi:hypothetical protein